MSGLTMNQLIKMPYVGTASQYRLSPEPWSELDQFTQTSIIERIIRAAGFVSRNFRLEDTITPVFGWQTVHGLSQDPGRWTCWLFGQPHPEENRKRYSGLSAALHLTNWRRPHKSFSGNRRCPLVMADLGPLTRGNHNRITSEELGNIALRWSETTPELQENNRRLEAFVCTWEDRAYLLSVPFFLCDIAYDTVFEAAEDTIATVCGPYVQKSNHHVPLWHIGNFENMDCVAKRAA